MTASRASQALALIAALLYGPRTSDAEPLRLRGDVLAASHAQAPAGLLTLGADGELRPWLSAEAMIWLGAGDESELDAMVIAVRARDPGGRGAVQLGRFVVIPGAIRPLHIDGADVHARGPLAMGVQVFGGVPVVPRFGAAAYDWVVGGRLSRAVGDWGSMGVAYMQRRESGRLADSEAGVDAGFAPTSRLDVGVRLAYDLADPGISEALISVAIRPHPLTPGEAAARRAAGQVDRRPWRLELFAGHRSPSRILPATSLFSVLGDVPSRHLGATATWHAAPRLDVLGTAAARTYERDLGADVSARGVLRLGDRPGAGALTLELRRSGAPDAAWTGARAAAQIPAGRVTLGAEVELAVPDDSSGPDGDPAPIPGAGDADPPGRGAVWPWGLVAVSAPLAPRWLAAAAIEAGAAPEHRWRVDGIARISYTWEAP